MTKKRNLIPKVRTVVPLLILVVALAAQVVFHKAAPPNHFTLFERGRAVLDIYADEVGVSEQTGSTGFYYRNHLVVALRPEAGLIWKEVK